MNYTCKICNKSFIVSNTHNTNKLNLILCNDCPLPNVSKTNNISEYDKEPYNELDYPDDNEYYWDDHFERWIRLDDDEDYY